MIAACEFDVIGLAARPVAQRPEIEPRDAARVPARGDHAPLDLERSIVRRLVARDADKRLLQARVGIGPGMVDPCALELAQAVVGQHQVRREHVQPTQRLIDRAHALAAAAPGRQQVGHGRQHRLLVSGHPRDLHPTASAGGRGGGGTARLR